MANELTVIQDVESTRWYKKLVGDCQEILSGAERNFVTSYYELGRRILKENDNFERSKIYGKEIVSRVTISLGIGERMLQRAIQLSRQYPESLDLPDGTTWRDVCNKVLPAYGKEARDKKKKEKRKKERAAKIAVGELAPKSSELFRLIHSPIETLDIEPGSIDVIITDPPYPEEYLPLYEVLAERAAMWLKPGGSLVVMIGQSYLPAIVATLSRYLDYQWTGAYLTPGGQSAQLWERKVNTFWKPVLWYVKGEYQGDWIGDVFQSRANEKESHDWQQSESGMIDLVEKMSNPGDLILDPFCGGGTTIKCAVQLGRRAIGSDISADCISLSAERIDHATS